MRLSISAKFVSTFSKLQLLILLFLSGHYHLAAQINSFPFIWSNDTLGDTYFEQSAMFIPVQFKESEEVFYFQLDTGSDRSFLYSQDIQQQIVETDTTAQSIQTNLGNIDFLPIQTNRRFLLGDNYVIGTLGMDVFQNSILEIDFPNQHITLLDQLDSAKYNLSPIANSYGRPVLLFEIGRKKYSFLFDTGSSIFSVWTTKKNWRKWGNQAIVNTYPIQAWGKTYNVFRSPIKDELKLAFSSQINFETIWYSSNTSSVISFKRIGIDGIIGNQPFLDEIILIDMKYSQFGIKKRPEFH